MKAERTRNFLRYYHPYHNSSTNRELMVEDCEKDSVLSELTNLERLAEIGRAVEAAFKDGFVVTCAYNMDGTIVRDTLWEIEKLLRWHKHNKALNERRSKG